MRWSGQSPALEEIRGIIAKVAPTDARVMITGQNGTGKEVVARRIHAQSERKSGPFVEVNCAAIPGSSSNLSCLATKRARSPAR